MGTYSNLLQAPTAKAKSEPVELYAQPTVIHRTHERSDVRTEQRTPDRTDERLPSSKRRTKRHSFEFYEDQLARLKQLSLQAELAGETLYQSEIVRQALDDYLAKEATPTASAPTQ